MDQVINLKHDNFERLAPQAIRNLGNTDLFSDVTLVSSDNKSVQVHKVILATFSRKLEKILVSNPHPNPLLYLRHIDPKTFLWIKNFIYLGEVEVPSHCVFDLIKKGGELGIVGLVEQGIEEDVKAADIHKHVSTNTEHSYEFFDEPIPGANLSFEEEEKHCDESPTNSKEQALSAQQVSFLSEEKIQRNDDGLFCCNLCEYSNKAKCAVKKHFMSKHEGVRYGCSNCEYKATTPFNLAQHVRSIHEHNNDNNEQVEVMYDCTSCDFKATYPALLAFHVKSFHTQVNYECSRCDYKTIQQNNLAQHDKSIHD